MAVPEQTPAIVSTANGVTSVFPYGFLILDAGDLLVQGTLNGVTTTYVLNVDYSVSGVGVETGGNVTFLLANPANGTKVLRKRNMAAERIDDYGLSGDLQSAELNANEDRSILLIQQIAEESRRSIRLPAHLAGQDGELPEPDPLKPLVWNAAGDGIDNGDTELTGDMALRGNLKGFYGPSLVADFGGVGNNSTDNATAFAAAEASSYSRIYLPSGTYYTTSNAFALTKHYHGPGQIRFSSGTRAPGRYTWVTARPATGTGSDFDRFFSADLSKVDASFFTLGGSGANLRKGLTEPYFESCTTPYFDAFVNWSGWSGVSARLTVAALAGAGSVTVNNATGIAIGQSLGFSASTGDPATQTITETVTVTNVVGAVISFSPNLANAYSIGARVTLGTRTMNPLEYGHVRHFGGGDAYVHVARMDVGYTRTSGQDHFFFTATGGLYGGEVNGTTEGVFLTGTEIKLVDNGNAVAAIGDIRNLQRTNATNTLGQRWGGYQVKSEGSQAVDWFYQGIGKSKRGIDFALADFGTDQGAIALAQNHRIYFKASGTADVAGFTLFGNIVGDCWMEYSSGVGGLNYVIGGTSAVQMTNLKVTTLVDAQFNAKAGFNGTAPIAKPTVTGSRGSNAALASLLTAFSSYGLITDSTTA